MFFLLLDGILRENVRMQGAQIRSNPIKFINTPRGNIRCLRRTSLNLWLHCIALFTSYRQQSRLHTPFLAFHRRNNGFYHSICSKLKKKWWKFCSTTPFYLKYHQILLEIRSSIIGGAYIGFYVDWFIQALSTADKFLVFVMSTSIYIGISVYILAMVKDMKMRMLTIDEDLNTKKPHLKSQQMGKWAIFVKEMEFHIEIIWYSYQDNAFSLIHLFRFISVVYLQCGRGIV